MPSMINQRCSHSRGPGSRFLLSASMLSCTFFDLPQLEVRLKVLDVFMMRFSGFLATAIFCTLMSGRAAKWI